MSSLTVKFGQNFSFQLEGITAVVSVERDPSSTFTGPFSLSYTSVPINATAGVDFEFVSGNLNFAAGENINVKIYSDASTDPLESFILNLYNLQAPGSSYSAITIPSHIVYIVDAVPVNPPTPTPTPTLTPIPTIVPETPTPTIVPETPTPTIVPETPTPTIVPETPTPTI